MGAEDSYGSAPAPFCPRAAAGRGRLPGSACFALRRAGGRNGTKAVGNDGESAPHPPAGTDTRTHSHTHTHRAPRPAASDRNPAAPDPAKSPGAAERPAGGHSAGPAAPLRSPRPTRAAALPPLPAFLLSHRRRVAPGLAAESGGTGGGEEAEEPRPAPHPPRGAAAARSPPARRLPRSLLTDGRGRHFESELERRREGGGGEGAEGGEEGSGCRACTARDGLRGAAATGGGREEENGGEPRPQPYPSRRRFAALLEAGAARLSRPRARRGAGDPGSTGRCSAPRSVSGAPAARREGGSGAARRITAHVRGGGGDGRPPPSWKAEVRGAIPGVPRAHRLPACPAPGTAPGFAGPAPAWPRPIPAPSRPPVGAVVPLSVCCRASRALAARQPAGPSHLSPLIPQIFVCI